MKKGFMKTLAALAAGAMLLSMNMSAFALTYGADTNYDATSGNARVTVTYTADAEEQVAFLAERGAEIIFIEQKEADGTSQSFSFNVDLDDATSGVATLKAGSTKTAYAENTKETINLLGREVTLSAVGEGYVAVDTNAALTKTVYEDTIEVYALPGMGKAVASISVNGVVQGAIIPQGNLYSITLPAEEEVSIAFTFADATVSGTPVATFTSVTNDSTDAERSITVFGTVANAVEGGILLSTEALNEDTAIPESYRVEAAVRAYPALAVNAEGQFYITLEEDVEGAKHLTPGTYNVGVYAVNANGSNVASGSTVTFE